MDTIQHHDKKELLLLISMGKQLLVIMNNMASSIPFDQGIANHIPDATS